MKACTATVLLISFTCASCYTVETLLTVIMNYLPKPKKSIKLKFVKLQRLRERKAPHGPVYCYIIQEP